jgi:hypothetical protein
MAGTKSKGSKKGGRFNRPRSEAAKAACRRRKDRRIADQKQRQLNNQDISNALKLSGHPKRLTATELYYTADHHLKPWDLARKNRYIKRLALQKHTA